LQGQGPLNTSHGKEDKTNGAYDSRSHGGHRSDRDDMVRGGSLLDTPNSRGNGHTFYSSSSSDRHYDRHRYHPYKRSDRGYFSNELKKYKLATLDGDFKKLEDAEAWLDR